MKNREQIKEVIKKEVRKVLNENEENITSQQLFDFFIKLKKNKETDLSLLANVSKYFIRNKNLMDDLEDAKKLTQEKRNEFYYILKKEFKNQ